MTQEKTPESKMASSPFCDYYWVQGSPLPTAAQAIILSMEIPPGLTTARLAWIINLKMNLTSRNVRAGWWRWHLDAPACAPAL